jgi:hypothetical protein
MTKLDKCPAFGTDNGLLLPIAKAIKHPVVIGRNMITSFLFLPSSSPSTINYIP